ncbi:MAG TPA: hypothetical protein DCQ06_11860 [Myxococcales bacterium]|nr:hypothetical protein [Myxococcales bacterium]
MNRRFLLTTLCLVLGFCLLPAGLSASESDQEAWVGISAGATPFSAGLHTRYRGCLSDYWALGASIEQGLVGSGSRTSATLDARLTIDALTFVPSIVASVGAGTQWQSEFDLVSQVALVLAWRPVRNWAAQLRVQVEIARSWALIGINDQVRAGLALSVGRIWSQATDLDFGASPTLWPGEPHRQTSSAAAPQW